MATTENSALKNCSAAEDRRAPEPSEAASRVPLAEAAALRAEVAALRAEVAALRAEKETPHETVAPAEHGKTNSAPLAVALSTSEISAASPVAELVPPSAELTPPFAELTGAAAAAAAATPPPTSPPMAPCAVAAELLGLRGDVAAGLQGIREVVGAALEGLRAVCEEAKTRAWSKAVTDLLRQEVRVGCVEAHYGVGDISPADHWRLMKAVITTSVAYSSKTKEHSMFCTLRAQSPHERNYIPRWETDDRLLLELSGVRTNDYDRSKCRFCLVLRVHDLKDPANAALAAAYAWALEMAFGAAPAEGGRRVITDEEVGLAYAPQGGPRVRLLRISPATLVKRWRAFDGEPQAAALITL